MAIKLAYVKDGDNVDYTNSAAVSNGDPVRLPDGRIGIAQGDYAANEQGAYRVKGVFEGTTASAATWNDGDLLAWDASAGTIVKKTLTLDGETDFVLGTAYGAQANGDVLGKVKLNEGPRNQGIVCHSVVYEFDCQTGVDATAHTLIPSEQNPHGLLLLAAYGIVTEVFAGTEDQGIVTIQDEDDTAICTLTASDAGADAVGDVIVGTSDVFSATTGDAAKLVAAGKAVEGIVSQATTGSASGKMKIYLLFMPLL